jgi:hypothetical protein
LLVDHPDSGPVLAQRVAVQPGQVDVVEIDGPGPGRDLAGEAVPAPERPMIATNWPGWMVAETWSSARLPRKLLATRSMLMTGDTIDVMSRATVAGLHCPSMTPG